VLLDAHLPELIEYLTMIPGLLLLLGAVLVEAEGYVIVIIGIRPFRRDRS